VRDGVVVIVVRLSVGRKRGMVQIDKGYGANRHSLSISVGSPLNPIFTKVKASPVVEILCQHRDK
jgi:hypothetical protein